MNMPINCLLMMVLISLLRILNVSNLVLAGCSNTNYTIALIQIQQNLQLGVGMVQVFCMLSF